MSVSTSKFDIRQSVTDRIIALMDRGVAEFRKLWVSQAASGFPRNATTEKSYSGINVLLLWAAADERGYTSSKWLTYKQAQELGGQVRRGEKSTSCVFFDLVKKKDDDGDEPSFYPMAKAFSLFNIEQIDKLPVELYEKAPSLPVVDSTKNETLERFLSKVPVTVVSGGSKAYFSPVRDVVGIPGREDFTSVDNYYAVTLHEYTHWTGHQDRLNRQFGKRFGDDAYAHEELVAELGSAFLCGHFGIVDATIENHACYLASWLKVLHSDKTAIFNAAKHAQAAFDYLIAYEASAEMPQRMAA